MESGFRPVATADFFAARFSPAPGSTCPENSYCLRIGFGIAPAGSAVVAVADFDLSPSCSAIAIAVDLDSARRRFVADLVFCFAAAEAVAWVFVSDAVSTARSSF